MSVFFKTNFRGIYLLCENPNKRKKVSIDSPIVRQFVSSIVRQSGSSTDRHIFSLSRKHGTKIDILNYLYNTISKASLSKFREDNRNLLHDIHNAYKELSDYRAVGPSSYRPRGRIPLEACPYFSAFPKFEKYESYLFTLFTL